MYCGEISEIFAILGMIECNDTVVAGPLRLPPCVVLAARNFA